jgi:hypothetical protein
MTKGAHVEEYSVGPVAGFTGSKNGMAQKQKFAIIRLLIELRPTTLHHGDCVGADEQIDGVCATMGIVRVAHPGDIVEMRANCQCELAHEPMPCLQRNKLIVATVDYLLAAPSASHEVLRSGTWATVRYARAAGIPIWVASRAGEIETFNQAALGAVGG